MEENQIEGAVVRRGSGASPEAPGYGETRYNLLHNPNVDRVVLTNFATTVTTTPADPVRTQSTTRRHPVHRFQWVTHTPPYIPTSIARRNNCVPRCPVRVHDLPELPGSSETEVFCPLVRASWTENQQTSEQHEPEQPHEPRIKPKLQHLSSTNPQFPQKMT